MILSWCSPIKRYTSEVGSVEYMTISVLKVGSYYTKKNLSFKSFQSFLKCLRNWKLDDKSVLLFGYYTEIVQWAGSFVYELLSTKI
jgi:hypothetical protein